MLSRRKFLYILSGVIVGLVSAGIEFALSVKDEASLESLRKRIRSYEIQPIESGSSKLFGNVLIENNNTIIDIGIVRDPFDIVYSELNPKRLVHISYRDRIEGSGIGSVIYRRDSGAMDITMSAEAMYMETDLSYIPHSKSKEDFLAALGYKISGETVSRLYLASKASVTESGIISNEEDAEIFARNYLDDVVHGYRELIIVATDYSRKPESVR